MRRQDHLAGPVGGNIGRQAPGPDGGAADKPVGTVWFGWSVEGHAARSDLQHFEGDRDAVRRQTVVHALGGLLALLGQ